MTDEQDNWSSRLAISFMPTGGSSAVISPITNFNPTIQLPKDVIDSIDACNLGFSVGNPRFSFDFEVTGINKSVFRKIFTTAIKGTRFSIVMATKSGESDDWYLDSIEFSNCVITDVSPSNITNDGKAPSLKFSAICLDFAASNNGETLIPTHTVGGTGGLN